MATGSTNNKSQQLNARFHDVEADLKAASKMERQKRNSLSRPKARSNAASARKPDRNLKAEQGYSRNAVNCPS
jgi:hypothetical protein